MSFSSVLPAIGVSFVIAFGVGLPLPTGLSGAAQAQTAAESVAPDAARIAALTTTMMMDEVIGVMREEGLAYGRTLASEMFPDQPSPQWDATVALIYDPVVMRKRFEAGLVVALDGADAQVSLIETFFASEVGQTALRLEVEARRALLDPAAEDAAKLAWEELHAEGGARVDQLTRFVEANDLIESNVMGALNANLAFYRGLAESGAFPAEMTEDQMLTDVWAQEPDVRAETMDWLYPFLSLAYQPLPDDQLDAYIAFSESDAGTLLNGALFAAFDKVFTQISYDLGRAVAAEMQGEDI